MYSIGEVSRMTGLSVRALHHYDAIGLLHPTLVSESGYRSYDDAALARLQRSGGANGYDGLRDKATRLNRAGAEE